ncbi:alpha/beta fold hydrolase [Pseudonocardia alaniniphila]|uniref:Alpha/beta fold hydrolase n=1 Tax=Pseudonocardia alaniniphila TaxID=75291 RepID=A0ABS9TGL9_9PSEU|nr:alpha/beta fold hydrolase [Pseudonocardia alaniniphila]MCH6167685.1 alpha/beta fold hydrolase [Pseudonocardia alaniniphila]
MPSTVVSPDGTELGFETVGDGPPMLLVHGAASDRHRWAPVQEQLARHYRVHMLDRRGRGLSTREALAVDAVAERVAGAYVVPMRGQAHQAMDVDPEQFVAAVPAFGAA